ncbi:YtrH family sporulation protein [Cohnella thailandensis]|uniref:YtrH family sporulation protein n=1 Tax=Cohnella thailandensis TaxID=557557 RepID=A0A841T0I6_9BACL|nr:YtrH family sporulation protein [Cohnella thailandensis]MBB6635918.1 YtrH family sporulation protein [Cohnella thailandensis]
MNRFFTQATLDFFVAFGVVLGASMLAGMASLFLWQSPQTTMLDIAARIKIWAVVVAIGGSIDPIRVIEWNVSEGYLSPAIMQIAYILFAFLGAHLAGELIQWMCRSAG